MFSKRWRCHEFTVLNDKCTFISTLNPGVNWKLRDSMHLKRPRPLPYPYHRLNNLPSKSGQSFFHTLYKIIFIHYKKNIKAFLLSHLTTHQFYNRKYTKIWCFFSSTNFYMKKYYTKPITLILKILIMHVYKFIELIDIFLI